jgi:non-ribosomal peptide synthetase component F
MNTAAAGDERATFGELTHGQPAHAFAARQRPRTGPPRHARRDFLAAILAVFKARHLPLDPAPPRRLAQVLRQSGSRLALVGDGVDLTPILESLPPERRPRVLRWAELVRPSDPDTDLPRLGGPASLAYVIYTSGSTGQPKGAMLEQRGMLNHLHAKVWDLGLGPDDVVAQNSAACFDVAVWQFSARSRRADTEVLAEEVNRDVAALLAETERRGITVLEIALAAAGHARRGAGGPRRRRRCRACAG